MENHKSPADLGKVDQLRNALLGERPSSISDPMLNWQECFPEIVGRSKPLSQVLETVAKVARSDSSVLIFGESGTGKELIAAALHRLSYRSSRRFVPINCSAIPESLLESELFGHEKGAFTGAVNRRPGLFELADGGTLFLDEIGDMPQRLQAKLLRVLQEKQFTSVGGHQIKSADVRILAATNIDLLEAVKKGNFRLDLFYRLNVLPVQLPPLRERREDIVDLLKFFLEAANHSHQVANRCFFDEQTIELLRAYDWPGNIRELQNLVERLVVTSNGGAIRIDQLPIEYRFAPERLSKNVDSQLGDEASKLLIKPDNSLPIAAGSRGKEVFFPEAHGFLPNEGLDLAQFIENLENSLIEQALARTANNKNQAAKLLGLNRTTLVERIKKRKIRNSI